MRLLLSGWCGLALAVFGSQPAHAAKRKPLPVPKDPLALATPTWTAGSAARGRVASQPGKGLRLGAVYPAPPTHKHPQPAEAISLFNASPEPIKLSGLRVEVVSYKRGQEKRRSMTVSGRGVVEPGEELWLAADAAQFGRQFGRLPTMAASGAGGEVVSLGDRWAPLPDSKGLVRLYQPGVDHVDTVAYNLTRTPWTPQGDALWIGPAVAPIQNSSVTGKRQLIRRDRDALGGLLPEFDGAKDYDSCSWHSGLGDDPVHRCFLAGQSDFRPRRHEGVAEVVATSAPDNNFKGLVRRFDSAQREILVSIYHFTGRQIADSLARAAQRGVSVHIYAEGVPVGGLPDKTLRLFRRLIRSGVTVSILRGDKDKQILKRFRYDHSKYAIIDREWVVIGTENYGTTGHPIDTRYGNRGWEIQIKNPDLVADLLKVWRWDTGRSNLDVVLGDERLRVDGGSAEQAPELVGPSKSKSKPKRLGTYLNPAAPLSSQGEMALQLVLSPDNSLSERGAIIGMVNAAQRELLVLQNSMPTRWGRGRKKVASPLVSAVVAAARRGVKTRVLLDAVFYQLDPLKPDGNDDTVRYLNALAKKEGLDLKARIIDLETIGLSKIHAKGVLVDGDKTFVGSQNWSENSFRGNREVGVVIESKAVNGYYRRLFWRDWRYSPSSRHPLTKAARVGKRTVPAGGFVDLVARQGARCTVRRRAHEGEIPCEQLGVRHLSASQTYVEGPGPAVVRGRVRKVHRAKNFVYLNFGEFWRQDYSVQIPLSVVETLAGRGVNVSSLAGQAVQVRGRLGRYNGPSLRVERAEDFEVLGLRKGSSPWP